MELLELAELHSVLADYAKDAVELYKYQIALGGLHGNKNASRRLTDNVRTEVLVDGTAYEVTITLQDYWKYIEGGQKGTESSPAGAVYAAHMPPPSVIQKWIEVKPILPRPRMLKSGKTKIPSPRSLSYAIAKSIERKGIEPFPALATTREDLDRLYGERIKEALGLDVVKYIKTLIRE